MVGTAIVMTITAPLVKFFGGGNEAKGYLVTMTIYGIVAMLIFFVTFASTKEVVLPAVEQHKTSLRESLKGLTGQAWILFLLNLFYFSLYVVRNTTVLYYFKYNLGRSQWLSLVGILGILSGLIAAFQGFFVKGGMGLTSFIIGAFLKKGGYVANTVHSEQALSCIELCFIWIPVILCLIIAGLTYFYKLDPIREEMTEELEQRRSYFVCEE